jgi:hypothetical protein
MSLIQNTSVEVKGLDGHGHMDRVGLHHARLLSPASAVVRDETLGTGPVAPTPRLHCITGVLGLGFELARPWQEGAIRKAQT